MALTKKQKEKTLEDLIQKTEKQKMMIFADFTGLKVKDLSTLRKKLKESDGALKVAKKTLARIAFKQKGIELETKKLSGQIAFIFGFKDNLESAKVVWQFSQTNPNLKIIGGFFENQLLAAEQMIELAQLPSREALLARLAGTILAPISNFVYALNANIKGLVYILANIKS